MKIRLPTWLEHSRASPITVGWVAGCGSKSTPAPTADSGRSRGDGGGC